MYKNRLLKLADFLENKVPSKSFDLSLFVLGRLDKNECGSAGCALGWCPKVFPRSKWSYELNEWGDLDLLYERKYPYAGAQLFFGISKEASSYLFDPSYYAVGHTGRKEVISRIRSFVRNNGNFKLIYHLHY